MGTITSDRQGTRGMNTSIYLGFDGCCEEAFLFYERVLGATIGHMLKFASSPISDQVPENWQDKIVNGDILLNGVRISGGDLLPDQYREPAGYALLLSIDSAAETKRLFAELADNGTILLPIQETFWSSSYGILTDRFGVTWKLNCTE